METENKLLINLIKLKNKNKRKFQKSDKVYLNFQMDYFHDTAYRVMKQFQTRKIVEKAVVGKGQTA